MVVMRSQGSPARLPSFSIDESLCARLPVAEPIHFSATAGSVTCGPLVANDYPCTFEGHATLVTE
jgi:hypothetical protein